ncbi:MAG: hypothetical protein ACYTF6_11100, partial [Planctomycetota bacterium]
VRPIRLYFNAEAREQWLRDMIANGLKNGMLTDEDAEPIESRIKEPFIQKYLKSLAVHVCTLPITQIVSVAVAIWYVVSHPELTWQGASARAGAILVAFQITLISPGSIVRGLYVVYLVIRERNLRDYNIAVFMGFIKYIGYLAFPIQMAYRYPALARFMAAHWATGAARVVPVFGERGALLEHGVFDLFYNRPLTIRRRIRKRAERRAALSPRYWHAIPIILLSVGAWLGVDAVCLRWYNAAPQLLSVWWLAFLLPFCAGIAAAAFAGGATVLNRAKLAFGIGVAAGGIYAATHVAMPYAIGNANLAWGKELLKTCTAVALSRVFIFGLAATLGAVAAETLAPEAD